MLFPSVQTVSSKGQFVIPALIRRSFGIDSGSKIIVSADKKTKEIKLKVAGADPIKDAMGILRRDKYDEGAFNRMLKQKYEEINRGE